MASDAPWPTTDAIFGPPSLALISGVATVPSVYTIITVYTRDPAYPAVGCYVPVPTCSGVA